MVFLSDAILVVVLRVLRLQPGHKYCLLGELSKEVGWNYHDTIRVSVFPLLFVCSFLLVRAGN